MALLWLAATAFGQRVRALTVDHGLRAGSASEAAAVGALAQTVGVAHAVLRWRGDKPVANRQAFARHARYRLMRGWCARAGVRWLLTAHHADDQAETVLMRLARGAGAGGLAGIRTRLTLGRGVTLLRPLLATRRASLAAVCAAAGLPTLDDPSNRDPAFDRTAARALLAATPWLDARRVAASAAHLADAEAALAWVEQLAWESRVTHAHDVVAVDAEGLPRTIRLRLVARAIRAAGGSPQPRGPELARLLDALDAGEIATLGHVRASGGPVWRFAREVG